MGNKHPALFVFASEHGTISAWNEQIMPATALPDVTRWFVEAACAAHAGARETLRTLKGPLAASL